MTSFVPRLLSYASLGLAVLSLSACSSVSEADAPKATSRVISVDIATASLSQEGNGVDYIGTTEPVKVVNVQYKSYCKYCHKGNGHHSHGKGKGKGHYSHGNGNGYGHYKHCKHNNFVLMCYTKTYYPKCKCKSGKGNKPGGNRQGNKPKTSQKNTPKNEAGASPNQKSNQRRRPNRRRKPGGNNKPKKED